MLTSRGRGWTCHRWLKARSMVCISMKAVMLRKAIPAAVNCCARCEKREMLPEIAPAVPLGSSDSLITNSRRPSSRSR